MLIEVTETQRAIERMHREEELGDRTIALRLGVSRKFVADTLDLPLSAFRAVRVASLPELPRSPETVRAARAAEVKARPRRFEHAPWHASNASDVTFRPFASDAIKSASRSTSP